MAGHLEANAQPGAARGSIFASAGALAASMRIGMPYVVENTVLSNYPIPVGCTGIKLEMVGQGGTGGGGAGPYSSDNSSTGGGGGGGGGGVVFGYVPTTALGSTVSISEASGAVTFSSGTLTATVGKGGNGGTGGTSGGTTGASGGSAGAGGSAGVSDATYLTARAGGAGGAGGGGAAAGGSAPASNSSGGGGGGGGANNQGSGTDGAPGNGATASGYGPAAGVSGGKGAIGDGQSARSSGGGGGGGSGWVAGTDKSSGTPGAAGGAAGWRVTFLSAVYYYPQRTDHSLVGAFEYTIPAWANIVDVILIGAGGGGNYNSGGLGFSTGGTAGGSATQTLVRGVDFAADATTIVGTVGQGGTGGTSSSTTGGNGAATVVGTLSAAGGVGGANSNTYGNGRPAVTYQNTTVAAAADQSGYGLDGNAPGGAGSGRPSLNSGNGGNGAAGLAVFVARVS